MSPAILDSPEPKDFTDEPEFFPPTPASMEMAQAGPHGNIVLHEWNILAAHADGNKQVFVDMQDLGIATVSAVSR